jgi:tetratricopeptide (TPR) repeat protein
MAAAPRLNRIAKGLIVAASMMLAAFPDLPRAEETAEPAVICQDDGATPEARLAACTRVIGEPGRPLPERVEALIMRAALNEEAERLDAAITDLDETLKLAPGDASAHLLRGNVHYARGDLDKALADYQAGIAAEPSDPAGYYNRAIVYEAMSERDKAIADYKKALELDPAFAEAKAALEELGVK